MQNEPHRLACYSFCKCVYSSNNDTYNRSMVINKKYMLLKLHTCKFHGMMLCIFRMNLLHKTVCTVTRLNNTPVVNILQRIQLNKWCINFLVSRKFPNSMAFRNRFVTEKKCLMQWAHHHSCLCSTSVAIASSSNSEPYRLRRYPESNILCGISVSKDPKGTCSQICFLGKFLEISVPQREIPY